MRVTRARKPNQSRSSAKRSPGFVGDMFRLVAAVALIGTVGAVTIKGVYDASNKAQSSHLRDRVVLARTVGGPLSDWLHAARDAADRYAKSANPLEVPGWDTLQISRARTFTGTSGRYLPLSGAALSHPCSVGAGLGDLVDSVARAQGAVALLLQPPGECDGVVMAAAAPYAGGTAVVTRDFASLLAHASVPAAKKAPMRTFVVDPAGAMLEPGQPAKPVPAYLKPVVAGVGPEGRSAHVTDDQHTRVVEAAAPLDGGWTVVVEQDAKAFDVGRVINPSQKAVAAVVVLFFLLLFLQALADARRRSAVRLAEAHTAAFLAVLGHELRTPLTVIKGFVDTLTSRWETLNETQRHDLVDRLPQQSRRLNRVVERLLLAANLQAGSAPRPTISSVDVGQSLERIAAEYRQVAPLHAFIVVAPIDTVVRADQKTLDQIIDQLVDNAVRYSPSGGMVRLVTKRRRGRIEIAIEDDGIGLPDNAEEIFEAFAQGEGVETRVHDEGGVGVGLYIVRTLSEQLGGSVRAEHRPEGGARFVVSLRPARQPVAERV